MSWVHASNCRARVADGCQRKGEKPPPCPGRAQFDAYGPGQDHNTTFGKRYAPHGFPMVCWFVNSTLADDRIYSRSRCGQLSGRSTTHLPLRALASEGRHDGVCRWHMKSRPNLGCREGLIAYVDEQLKRTDTGLVGSGHSAAPAQGSSDGNASPVAGERQEL